MSFNKGIFSSAFCLFRQVLEHQNELQLMHSSPFYGDVKLNLGNLGRVGKILPIWREMVKKIPQIVQISRESREMAPLK